MRFKIRRKQSLCGRFLFSLLFLLSACNLIVEGFEEVRCKTMDIRNVHEFPNINKNCTIIEGSFLMSMVNTTTVPYPRFERLREVTGSVLIFLNTGLKSLKRLFPNLRVIGGKTLIQHYSLIVYQNHELEELGLDNLRVIRNGGVRITENFRLCNAKAINWLRLLFGPINDIFVDDSAEISEGEGSIFPCTNICVPKHENRCLQTDGTFSCWSKDGCQLACDHDRNATHIGPGCSDDVWDKCHEECIGGCTAPNDPSACYACAHISHDGKCLASCPKNLFSYLERRCVTKASCENLEPRRGSGRQDPWKAFNDRCHYHCPDKYEEDPVDSKTCRYCGEDCIRKCKGNVTIDSLSKARTLEKCTLIDGNLEIAMRIGMESVDPTELTKSFGRINVIDGYLQIRLSPSFVNFHMFKNLHTITGRYLYREKYAITVFENANLQKLFPPNSKFNVTTGYLQFQNNKMLCFDHIVNFMTSLGREKEMNELDQSRNSNGEKAICSESSFDVTVDVVSSSSFRLQWKAFNTTDIDYRKFLGYEIMYKEVEKPDEKMSIDDDRSACSDSWNSQFLEVKTSVSDTGQVDHGGEHVKVEIANNMIKPNTYYAFYVTTALVRHEGARNAISRIGFLRTYFGNPEPPILKVAEERGTDSIYLQWDPPVRPNGEITHYIVTYKPQPADHYAEEYAEGCQQVEENEKRMKELEEVEELKEDALLSTPSTVFPINGTCQCEPPKSMLDGRKAMENGLRDSIFVQNVDSRRRRKRSLLPIPYDKDTAISRIEQIEKNIRRHEVLEEPKRVTVNGTSVLLKGLDHYTTYFISISACQNTSATKHFCSERKAWKNVLTRGIREKDLVDNSTIKAETIMINGTYAVNITWEAPNDPNGLVRYYEVTVINQDTKSSPFKDCRGHKGGWTPQHGHIFRGLGDGTYRVEIRTRSLLGKISDASARDNVFKVQIPGFWTIDKIVLAVLLIIIFIVLTYFIIRRYYGVKMIDYAREIIMANPDYLSQQDMYKPDEWELLRAKLTVEECIGSGTFGKVFKGYGHNLKAVNGHQFGACAIKTTAEGANTTTRIHFLLEASVMKKFDAQHIVKLYGVVSDGQPVFVVMELMEHGNLRDYLRSRRPGEDGVDEHGQPPPTEKDFLLWALQIADGMSYLQSLRFCHRDIAARNCLVDSKLIVKIGDFGMTRDLCYREYYKPGGLRVVPVKWMAPESLLDGRFDIKSDVWSFGVVLFEMWSLGEQPYPTLSNNEMYEHVARQMKILDQPRQCPDWWYNLMKECWRYAPVDRPDFFDLVEELLEKAESNVVPRDDLRKFADVSFAVKHREFNRTESHEDPEPLGHFIGDQIEMNAINRRGDDDDSHHWEEGEPLRRDVAEDPV